MKNKNKIIFILAILVIVFLTVFGFEQNWWSCSQFEISSQKLSTKIAQLSSEKDEKDAKAENSSEEDFPVNPITGLPCQKINQRPFAVMLASDEIARPLSGISSADLIFEMPVISGGITRLMALYMCELPGEIGSIRSARHDFIPLAQGFDAIFVHWGGSHFALDKLNRKIIDNIDALKNPYAAFYRKRRIPRPHNGFSSGNRLISAAYKLGFRLENNFEGYPHYQNQKSKIKNQNDPRTTNQRFEFGTGNSKFKNDETKKRILTIGYPYPFNVEYKYDPETNFYSRWRGGRQEIDKINSKQVKVKNVVVMRARSRQIEGQYNDVDIEGEGDLEVYQLGKVIKGKWVKDKFNKKSKLYFLNELGEEIKFVPGKIWVEIVEPYQKVKYENEN